MSAWNSVQDQVQAYRPDRSKNVTLGKGTWRQDTGFFTYKHPRLGEIECECDLQLKEKIVGGMVVGECIGLQMMCPRCEGGLYIRGTGSGADLAGFQERAIVIHWDAPARSEVDGLLRPTVTVEEPFACDYSWSEVNGIAAPRGNGILDRCGWRGAIIRGRLIDHQVKLHRVV